MPFGVFVHRADSIYSDLPTKHYQFPSQYLRRAQDCVGGWIVYYAPRRAVGTRGYYAIAKVSHIMADPSTGGMYLALIEPGSYQEFASAVPFSGPLGWVEQGLLNDEGKISGRAQAAIRSISPSDFNRIITLGFDDHDTPLPRIDASSPGEGADLRLREDAFPFEQEGDRIRYYTSRVVRDRIFRQVILRAYDERCAVTGLKLINGGGRAEVEAAHIQPVDASGPDIVNNGIALSGTAHWMFDRGLISLSDNLEILVSRQVNDPGGVRAMINASGYALLPNRASDRPHPHFLSWHREHCFKH